MSAVPRSLRQIVDDVEEATGIEPGAIRDMTLRSSAISLARHVAYYVARRETRLSWKKIADEIGSGDHRGIMYGFNRIAVAIAEGDKVIAHLVEEVAPTLDRRVKVIALSPEERP